MAELLDLVAEFREDTGKGSSRRLRHAGKVPAIIYGAGREPRKLSFNHNDLLKATEQESFFSSVLNVKVGENVRAAILKDIQVHPAKRQIMHLDLQRIVEDEDIRMTVPLHYLNEEAAPGIKTGGGTLSKMVTEVEVVCLPRFLPKYISIDVGDMELDQSLHLSDLQLPEGVTLTLLAQDPPNDESIAALQVLRAAAEPEEDTTEGGADGAEVDPDKPAEGEGGESDS
jgi:large subunit ribosomal protein L25